MNANEMIDRYVNEVGENLPRKVRADIEMELRSLLLDALEEQSDGEPSPKIAAEVLREFGHPEKIAAQYRPEEALIGPKLFPEYKMGLKVMVSIIGLFHLVGLGFALWQGNGAGIVDQVLDSAASFGRAAIFYAGILTLVFALIERTAGDVLKLPEKQTKAWNPYELPPVKDPDRIKRAELLVGIVFSLIFIGWLNFFPNWFGGAEFNGEDSGIFVLVTAEFIQLVPWITASWLLDVTLKTAVLIQGRWNRVTRWLEIAVGGFGLLVVYRIFSLEAVSTVPFFSTMAKLVLAVVMVIVVLDLLAKLFKLLWGRPFAPIILFKSKPV
ncbi:MAG: hypothetical protein DHS20C20_20980 [Ardenticatenaceae bacterium]|nr:MAG: hypothetical protein DHS20C20_20980 [Ardenticatenaceae bacterium]